MKMEIRKVDQGKDKRGFYFKYEIPKYDGGGKPLSDLAIRKAIREHLYPVPVEIKKRKDNGYYEAMVGSVSSSYRHIYAQLLN